MSYRGVEPPRDSRVLIFSRRSVARQAWHASQYEFEDLVIEMDDASLIAPLPHSHPSFRSMSGEVLNTALRSAGGRRRTPGWPAHLMSSTRITTEHDVLLAVVHHPNELAYLHSLRGWRDRARTTVCVLIELWRPWIERDADYLQLLRSFDHVYLFNPSVGDLLAASQAIPPPRYLPMGVDALLMSPLPGVPARVVDVYSYGRRSPAVHQRLLGRVQQQGLTYLYDTLGNALFRDHTEHRSLLANVMKRSAFFLAHSINDSPVMHDRTEGQDATLSARYFEGAAAGAVLLGSRPKTPVFDDAFPWDDVVVPLRYDGTDTVEVLTDLVEQPDRLARIRADNVRGTLLRHDWAYRWQTVLKDVGLEPTERLTARLLRLQETAAAVTPETVVGRGLAL